MAYFFFFQAEDGIRDLTVTGVQTCALPISPARSRRAHGRSAQAGTVSADGGRAAGHDHLRADERDRKSTRLNSSHSQISYAVFCLKKKKNTKNDRTSHNTSRL